MGGSVSPITTLGALRSLQKRINRGQQRLLFATW
jgi:hypothetical protein